MKITPPAPPVLNGADGVRWELLFADERSDEVLSRLTASAPVDSLSFGMARPASEHFPVEELQICVNAVLRREATEVLNLGPSDGHGPLKEASSNFSVRKASLRETRIYWSRTAVSNRSI